MLRMLPNLPRLLMAALLLLLGIAQPTLAGVFCVNTPANLQSALTTAAGNGVDDEVWIVQGTYVGNFVYASTEAQALAVLGGYTAGCSGRLLDPANTILDGNQTGTVLRLSAPEVAAEFLVEGLTLRKGSSSGLSAVVGSGGEVMVDNNFISANTASASPPTTSSFGGGVYLKATTAMLSNNSITGNTASYGGGAYISVSSNYITGNATLTNNIITDNSAYSGGGVHIPTIDAAHIYATTATLTNNSVTGNRASYDGGGAFISVTTATLTNNIITGNTTYWGGGGGAGIKARSYGASGTATLTNNIITGNTAPYDGGVYISPIGAYTTATLTNNSITGNAGTGASITASTATLTNNSITDNTGTGASITASTATLTNNSITGNTAETDGGLRLWLGNNEATDSATLYNNLFWANRATGTGAAADLRIDNDQDGDHLPTPVTLLANSFDQSAAGLKITLPITIDPSNLDAEDPLFVNQSAGNLRLTSGSPMIDAGNTSTPDLPEFDIEGTPRVLGNSVDIGAYEFDDSSDPLGTLSVTLAGTGSGRVTSSPTGINCGSDCFQAYGINTLVTLTATPTDTNSVFDGWSGDADCEDGQVTMDANLSCTATFGAIRQLTVIRAGDGSGLVTSTPSGIACGAACVAYFYLDESVTLTAVPDTISTFVGWSGDPSCPHPILDSNRACAARFDPILYRLFVFVFGTGSGTVTSVPAGITCNGDCEEDYRANTLISLTAKVGPNSVFEGWAGPCTGTNVTCQVTMSDVVGVTAIFESDLDNDLIKDTQDNCPSVANANQADADFDGIGDVCDDSPGVCQQGAVLISTPTFLSGVNSLASEVSITTQSTLQVQAGADVTFIAPVMRFGPGFSVASGAKFKTIVRTVTCSS